MKRGSPVTVPLSVAELNGHGKHRRTNPRNILAHITLWLRYVDDRTTAVHNDQIDEFHKHLNKQNADIQFTKEIEENGKIPSLSCLHVKRTAYLPLFTENQHTLTEY